MIVVSVLITNCQVSEKWKIGPVIPHRAINPNRRKKCGGRSHRVGGVTGALAEQRADHGLNRLQSSSENDDLVSQSSGSRRAHCRADPDVWLAARQRSGRGMSSLNDLAIRLHIATGGPRDLAALVAAMALFRALGAGGFFRVGRAFLGGGMGLP